MLAKLDQDIYHAISTTLENMAFIEVGRELGESIRYAEEEMVVSRLLIYDPLPGELYLSMPKPLLARIASSVYILPAEELSDQMVLDMLGELINTVAGLFLNAYLPEDQTYKLGLPENVAAGQDDSPFEIKEWEFQVDNDLFTLTLAGDEYFQDEAS